MMGKAEMGKPARIQGAIRGACAVKEAAQRLYLGERRVVKQLKRQMRLEREGAVLHWNPGKHPASHTGGGLGRGIATLPSVPKGAGIVSRRKHRNGGKKFSHRKRHGRAASGWRDTLRPVWYRGRSTPPSKALQRFDKTIGLS
jgi:hypothetical protein